MTELRVTTTRRAMAALEVAAAAIAVTLDLVIPTLVILVLAAASLAYRRERPSSLGFRRPSRPGRMIAEVMLVVVAWTCVQVALLIPLLEHVTGQRQDVSAFAELEGNLGALLVLLVLSWTLAAIGEETAYRGFVQTRAGQAAGGGTVGLVLAILLSAGLFGLAHTEQGVVGVALTFLDGVLFSLLRVRYRTLWAPILAHGFNNTIGLTAYFLIGPVYGLW